MQSTVPGWKPWSAWFSFFCTFNQYLSNSTSSYVKWAAVCKSIWGNYLDTDINSKANSPSYVVFKKKLLIQHHPGYHIAFQYYSHLLSSWKSETSLSSRHITTSKIWSVQLQYIWFRGDIDKHCRDWYSMGTNTTRVKRLSQDHSVWKSM